MARILAAGALRSYKTWADICAIRKPHGRNHRLLDYEDYCLDMPVFPRCRADAYVDDKRTSSLASHTLPELGRRTGFRESLTFHASRREALLKVDSTSDQMVYHAKVSALTDHQVTDTPTMNACGLPHIATRAPMLQPISLVSVRSMDRQPISSWTARTLRSTSYFESTHCVEITTTGHTCQNRSGGSFKTRPRLTGKWPR